MSRSIKDLLVVVPCLNEERTISAVLDRLLADACASRVFVVVADGGSQDLSRRIVQRYVDQHPDQVAMVDNRERYQSAGVNLAVACYGEGRSWLVRADAHAEYPPDFLARLVTTAERTQADSVVVPMRSSGHTCQQRGVAAAQNSIFGTGASVHRHPGHSAWVEHGHHALFRLAAFEGVRGYDPRFSHNEDAELDLRLTKAGARIWLDGDLAIEYFPRRTFKALLSQYVAYGKGRARTVALHKAKLRIRQRMPLLVTPAILLSLLAPMSLWAAAPAGLWLAGCAFAGVILGIKERSLCALIAGPPALAIMHAGWSFGFWAQCFSSQSKDSVRRGQEQESPSQQPAHISTRPERQATAR